LFEKECQRKKKLERALQSLKMLLMNRLQ